MNRIRVYNWNSNGTNDIEILDENHEVLDALPEALFGLNIGRTDDKVVPLSLCLKHIALSPVSDGSDVVRFLAKYFKI